MSILGSDFPTRSVGTATARAAPAKAAPSRAVPAKAALAKAIAHLNLSYVNFFHMPLNFDILMHILSESVCDGFVWW